VNPPTGASGAPERPTVPSVENPAAPSAENKASVFEAARPRLAGVAYRMLGSRTDADDVVQDAWLRFASTTTPIDNPAAWLTTVVTRLAIDELRTARRTRATYVGPWLAEPTLDAPTTGADQGDPADQAVLLESITIGFLAVLERLSPLERAVFVLHDVFALPLTEVAEMIERSEAATRQLAKRARDHLAVDRPRFDPDPDDARVLTEMLLAAAATGDIETIASHLAADVVYIGDGGPNRRAARRPVVGADKVARLFANLAARLDPGTEFHIVRANGQTAVYATVDAEPLMLLVPTWRDGRVAATYSVLNPDKLRPFHNSWLASR
jgi:RNA polymerase sigma-70 factor, ECF subfamily